MPIAEKAATLQQRVDQCVKCGLCLPVCPTYRLERHEADSPRGRIALVQGLAAGTLTASPVLERHLDGCLSCRACELVCPAEVSYSAIADAGRELLGRERPQRLRLARALQPWLASIAGRGLLRVAIRIGQRLGLLQLADRLPARWRRLARMALYPVGRSNGQPGAAMAEEAQTLRLFRGCVTDIFERDALSATVRLLERAGYRVEAPRGQTCCGALSQHAGDLEAARGCAERNLRAMPGSEPVVATASGCAAALRDYPDLMGASASAWSAAVTDPATLLAQRLQRLSFGRLRARVAVHTPCTQRNVLRSAAATATLLRQIPDLEIVELDPQQQCCGAAGIYFLTQPDTADRLLDEKLSRIAQLSPDLVLSSNIGCSLHLAAGMRGRGLQIPLRHPLTLLAAQLGADG